VSAADTLARPLSARHIQAERSPAASKDGMTIESPCNLVCTLDPSSGYCFGCGRTGDEIACWASLTATERRALMDRLPDRLAMLARPPRRQTQRSLLARSGAAGGTDNE
jgi:hypothetical protein